MFMKLSRRRKSESQKAFVRWFIAIAPRWVTGIMSDRKIKYSKVRLVNKIRDSFAWNIESVMQEIDGIKEAQINDE
jgi:hypothetical protein